MVELHSDPVVLGEVVTDAAGAFRLEVRAPGDAEVGEHTVVATAVDDGSGDGKGPDDQGSGSDSDAGSGEGDGSGAGAGSDIAQDQSGPLPQTVPGVIGHAAVVLALMVAGGIALAVRRRGVAGTSGDDQG